MFFAGRGARIPARCVLGAAATVFTYVLGSALSEPSTILLTKRLVREGRDAETALRDAVTEASTGSGAGSVRPERGVTSPGHSEVALTLSDPVTETSTRR
ncbi:hypothetical protein [Amycolatopsis sp. NPDC057786]|uniref:hypothetical protein n=1 Tax=Amycolatopsis sp. NPDC057786 TaxID=3346250 RepID=UPI00366C62FC